MNANKLKIIKEIDIPPEREKKISHQIRIISIQGYHEDQNDNSRPNPKITKEDIILKPSIFTLIKNVIPQIIEEPKEIEPSSYEEPKEDLSDCVKKKIMETATNYRDKIKKMVEDLDLLTKEGKKFSYNYKKLKDSINSARDEIKDLYQKYKIDSNSSLCEFITEINDTFSKIEDNVREKKQQLIDMGIINEEQNDLLKSVVFGMNNSESEKFKASTIIKINMEKEHIEKKKSPSNFLEIEEFFNFKIEKCPNKSCYDMRIKEEFIMPTCNFYHSDYDLRRDVIRSNVFYYSHDGICNGCFSGNKHESKCFYGKNYYEFYYHPLNYKKVACQIKGCLNKFCPFYHYVDEKSEWRNKLYSSKNLSKHTTECRPIPDSATSNLYFPPGFCKTKMNIYSKNKPSNYLIYIPKNQEEPKLSCESKSNQNTENNVNLGSIVKSLDLVSKDNQFEQDKNIKKSIVQTINNTSNYDIKTSKQYEQEKVAKPSILDSNSKPLNPSIINYSTNQNKKIVITEEQKASLRLRIDYYIQNDLVSDDNFADEDKNIEYKFFKGPTYKPIDYQKIFKTICGFLNADGGILYIGVDDITHCVRGTQLQAKDYDDFKLNVVKTLKELFSPSVMDELFIIKRIPVLKTVDQQINKKTHNLFLIKIDVSSDNEKVYYIKKTIDGEPIYTAYMRHDGMTKIMTGIELNYLFERKILKKVK